MKKWATQAVKALMASALMSTASCQDSEPKATGSETDSAAVVDVTVASTSPSAFCVAINNLGDFEGQPTTDDAARAEHIASIYEQYLPELPDTIRPDFEAVIAHLRGETTSSVTSDPATSATGDAGEDAGGVQSSGYEVDATPVDRVYLYITYTCTGAGNNPGPPPTTPR